MRGDTTPVHAFDAAGPALSTAIGGEPVLLTRVGADGTQPPVVMQAAVEDAFAMVAQLRPLPAHTLWHDHQPIEIVPGPAGALTLLDLGAAATATIDGAFDSLHLHIPRVALDRFADLAGTPRVERLHLPGGPFTGIDPVVASLAPALTGTLAQPAASPLLADHLLMALLAHLTGRYGELRRAASPARGGLSPAQLRRATALLDPADGPAPLLADVAAAAGVSLAHFARAFKASAGLSPWVWHQARRIEHAEALLRDPSLPLSEIAGRAGFADQSHFTRAFAGARGLAPGQWRRERGIDGDRPQP